MTQNGFFFDQSRCYDCKACAIQCKDWNGLEPGPEKWLRIFSWETGTFPQTRLKALFAPCFHCENPQCVSACSKGAIFKEERYGAVLVDKDLCDGCRSCWDACPYGAVSYWETDAGLKMSKCTMCIDRLQNDQKPACVTSCPMRALDFGVMTVLREKYGDLSQLDTMPCASFTTPSVVFKPAEDRKQLIPFDANRAIELFGNREGFDPLYEESSELTELFEGLVGRDHLNMKPSTDEELMFLTKNDEG